MLAEQLYKKSKGFGRQGFFALQCICNTYRDGMFLRDLHTTVKSKVRTVMLRCHMFYFGIKIDYNKCFIRNTMHRK